MSFPPRLRQSCRGNHRGVGRHHYGGLPMGQGPSALSDALDGHPPGWAVGAQQGQDVDTDLNLVVLQGEVIDGRLDPGSNGWEKVAVITISFPDGGEFWASESLPPASCEIEVPRPVAGRFGKRLRVGDDLHVVGMVGDKGHIVAWLISTEPPFERP